VTTITEEEAVGRLTAGVPINHWGLMEEVGGAGADGGGGRGWG